jgi:uncharacterized cupredoxin-like copper-binding protein
MRTSLRCLLALAALAALPVAAERTISLSMDDSMRYSPAEIHAKRGEALRIVATNRGKLVHEVVIGTRAELEAHARHMREHPHMEHHDAEALRVPAGETREMEWRPAKRGDYLFGCLEPGHFEAGMVGRIVVE